MLIVAAGVRSAAGVLFVPLENDMHWSAATISIAVAIGLLLYGITGPFAAALMQTIGVRSTILIALAVVAVSTAATSLVTTPLGLVLTWGVGVGLGVGTISMVLATVVATRWFVVHRGTVLGALTSATATGQLLFIPLLAYVAQKDGWRFVGIVVAGAALLVAIPIAFFMRDRPEAIGLRPVGAETGGEAASFQGRGGNPLRHAFDVLGRGLRRRDFLIVAGTFFVCGASTNGFIGTHFIAVCGDHGIPQVRAAGILATMGVFSLVGTTASGWLSDRFSCKWLLFTYYGLRGLSLLILPYVLDGAGIIALPIFMVFYGLDWLATVPPNVRILTDAMGKDDAPIAYGWIGVSHQLGAGTIALLAGVLRTGTGSYNTAFDFSGVLCLIAAVAVLGVGIGRVGRLSRPATAVA